MGRTETHETHWNEAPRDFARHVRTMPRWHKAVLSLGVVLLLAGAAGWVVSRARSESRVPGETKVTAPSAAPAAASSAGSPKVVVPPNASGFVGTSSSTSRQPERPTAPEPAPSPSAAATSSADPVADDLLSKLSPNATKIGGSVVGGFVVGWLFRAFLKTMAMLALLAGGGLFALSYFGIIEVDFVAMRAHYADAAQWVTAQGMKIKDAVVAHLPSTGAGTLGAFLGFRRR
jgi:uncharacterized membrane protein (Fun14 family)